MGWHDLLGLGGVAVVLLAYALLQTGRMRAEQPLYSILNAVGALAILVSLTRAFNLAAMVMQVCWLLLSMYGLWRARRVRSP